MGHKWMWNPKWGGLPPEEFLVAVDPLFAGVRAKMGGEYLTSDHLAGHLSGKWAAALGLREGIPIPVGAFDAHWDAIGSNIREGDAVNVVGTSTCVIAMARKAELVPGVCGVVPGSVHPQYTGIEAGLSAVGDIFDAIAKRAGTTVAALSEGLEAYKAGQTGLLRLSWDNGDRTVLVNPELGGVTLGWNLIHTAQDELFAAIEGTAFHTRIILERMAEYGVRIDCVINAGGVPQKNEILNRVYANVLKKPVLVPAGIPTSLGSGIFALLAAGAYKTIEEAQAAVCLPFRTVEPDAKSAAVYEQLYRHYACGSGECVAGAKEDCGGGAEGRLNALTCLGPNALQGCGTRMRGELVDSRVSILRSGRPSNAFENLFFGHILVRGNGSKDRVQRPDSKWIVRRDRDAMRRRLLGFKNDMAANLMDLPVSPVLREVLYERASAQVTRQFHATASTSSRTRRRRIEAGGTVSK
jgi:hypothetical protein